MKHRMMWNAADSWMGVFVICGAVFYRPLTFWADNAWDLSAPQDILGTGLLELAIGIGLFILVRSVLLTRTVTAALLVGTTVFIGFNWDQLGLVAPMFWLLGATAGVLAVHRFAKDKTIWGVATVIIVVWLVAPMAQVITSHFEERTSYPILPSVGNLVPGEPTGAVEDVLVLIVDSYPMAQVADSWFDHDMTALTQRLSDLGFETPFVSWSQNTFTGLAVPSMMELSQVIDDSPKGNWGNRKDRYDIARGASFVVSAFRSAGFKYTHVESGWNGGVCADTDVCLHSQWFDGANSLLLGPSIFDGLLTSVLGPPMVGSSLRSAEHLNELDVFGDGQLDYVYAHFLLPHRPYVVDSNCAVLDQTPDNPTDSMRISEQLGCVDSLLLALVSSLPRDTAVLIAGDHGTATNGQLGKPEVEWTDSDIAERLGAYLAYRIPSHCHAAEMATNVAAMRAIVDCALTIEKPTFNRDFVIGEHSPQVISATRIAAIEDGLRSGELSRAPERSRINQPGVSLPGTHSQRWAVTRPRD